MNIEGEQHLPRGEISYRVLESLSQGPKPKSKIKSEIEEMLSPRQVPLSSVSDAVWRLVLQTRVRPLGKSRSERGRRLRLFGLTEKGNKTLRVERERRNIETSE